MQKSLKSFKIISALILVGLFVVGCTNIIPYIGQLQQERVGTNADTQPKLQKGSSFIGSKACQECHKQEHDSWQNSLHAKMIQDVNSSPKAISADFTSLPKEADFHKEDIVYTIGSKFKQRYMIRDDGNISEDYRVGNMQFNLELKRWERTESKLETTSANCDWCHFVGFASRDKRVEPSIGCESCHGPGSAHAKKPEEKNIYNSKLDDPHKANELCFQCHLRNPLVKLGNNDKVLGLYDKSAYAKGYEPGKELMNYKEPLDFMLGVGDKNFYANGVAKINRMQGNEYVDSAMHKHGITCVNCHEPHKLSNAAQSSSGNKLCLKCHDFGSVIGPHSKDLQSHTRHKIDSNGSSCIECHMPKTARHADNSPLTVRTHKFGFIFPEQTKKYGVPNGCNSCHKDKSTEWSQQHITKWGMQNWSKR
jgi:predicted CXXCH cytochrome family protein